MAEAAEYTWLEGRTAFTPACMSHGAQFSLRKQNRLVVRETTGYPYDRRLFFQVENHALKFGTVKSADPRLVPECICRIGWKKETDHTDGAGFYAMDLSGKEKVNSADSGKWKRY